MANKSKRKHPDISALILGNSCIMLATIFWGVNVAVTKALIPDWMSASGISVVRLIGGCCLFWIASIFVKCQRIEKGDWLHILAGGTIGLFAFIWLFVLSLRFGSAIDISIIMTLPPMFVIIMGILFNHQRPLFLEYAGLVISFAGAVIVIVAGSSGGSEGSDNLLGDVIAICSCICYAFYLFILQKPSAKYHPLSLLRWIFLFAAIPALSLTWGMQDMPILRTDNWIPWLEIGFILFCPTFFAYFLVQPAIRNIGSELTSLYQYLLPVFAAITAVLMGLEQLQWSQVIAMAVIVLGMILTNIGKSRRVRKETA